MSDRDRENTGRRSLAPHARDQRAHSPDRRGTTGHPPERGDTRGPPVERGGPPPPAPPPPPVPPQYDPQTGSLIPSGPSGGSRSPGRSPRGSRDHAFPQRGSRASPPHADLAGRSPRQTLLTDGSRSPNVPESRSGRSQDGGRSPNVPESHSGRSSDGSKSPGLQQTSRERRPTRVFKGRADSVTADQIKAPEPKGPEPRYTLRSKKRDNVVRPVTKLTDAERQDKGLMLRRTVGQQRYYATLYLVMMLTDI